MNPVPLVSIVIPAFNPRFFQAALASALSQTYANVQVIVCDDSPGSDIKTIVDSFADLAPQLRYVRNAEHLGLVGNLKACLDEADGEYIKFLCDDDQLFPACIKRQVNAFVEQEDARLVFGQRLLWDANDMQLPSRLENSALAPTSAIYKGDDLLSIFDTFPVNFLGGFSNALFRRVDVLELLPALTQPGHCFVATLDFALYVCLMRRGNVVVLNDILGMERLYPGRLSRQQPMMDAALAERQWLLQMLKARSGESAPAPGWVRYLPLSRAAESPRVWVELPLSRSLGTKQTTLPWRVGIESLSFTELYTQWLMCRTLSEPQKKLLPDTLDSWAWRPKIIPIIIDEAANGASLEVTLRSIAGQFYPADMVVVLSSACTEVVLNEKVLHMPYQQNWQQQLNEVLEQLEGADWIYLLRPGDRLLEPALLVLAERIVAFEDARCLYSDEGGLCEGESADPAFKPDFNLDLMRSYPYVGRTLAFDRTAFLAIGGLDPSFGELAPHDLLWRLVERQGTQVVEHINELLVESQSGFAQWLALPELVEQNTAIVQAHLQRLGIAGEVRKGSIALINRVEYEHADRPLVSIIIASKDQLAAMQRCVESLLEKTAYSAYEILLVDNGSEQAETLAWLNGIAQLGIAKLRVLSYPEQRGIAALRNFASRHAAGDYLLMLNPFAVITQGDWLDELLNHGQRPEVAVVGAKLFNPDGRILHAGVILGLQGPAGVPFYGDVMNAAGYMHRLQVVQDLSAVGGDCLLVRKAVFDEVGGLDDQGLAHTLSEIDLCLRIRQNGYLVVWTPYSRLALGSQPAPVADAALLDQQAREQETYYKRWLPIIARDPAYNTNLALNTLGGSSFNLEPGLRTGWSPFVRKTLPVVAGLPINASAVGHYRVTQPMIELEAAGRLTGRIYYDMPTIIELERLAPDAIILQCRYSEGPVNEIIPLKTYSKARRIYELDDYVVHTTKKNAHARNKPGHEEMERLVRKGIGLCDRVVVTTYPLADALSSMHDDIRVVPNMLAPHLWGDFHCKRRVSRKPRVGWGGGTSHQGDLEVIADVVRELADEVEWVFFGMCPDELRPYVHEFHGLIDLDSYPAKLASLNLDLALAPLEFHIFNDCKSNLRLLEYGACGYPVVCTDTAAYRGYLPCTRVMSNTTEEWLQAIRMHLADPDASYRMGDQLREFVLRDFMLRGDNLDHWINAWFGD
ncbi:glycosyltransferase [Pseudomonas sp. DWP3-1-2]|uniref:glycosyltransferase n=1 Tax=Pseudomonas sp. DWP3-1-2 TaxID=2804645 RepID=UPI003CF452C3